MGGKKELDVNELANERIGEIESPEACLNFFGALLCSTINKDVEYGSRKGWLSSPPNGETKPRLVRIKWLANLLFRFSLAG